jgi:hypothetical protein
VRACVRAGCNYSSAVAAPDGKIYAVGSDKLLREISDSQPTGTWELPHSLTQVSVSHPPSTRMLLAGSELGLVKCIKFPVTLNSGGDMVVHSGAISRLRLTHDDSCAAVFSSRFSLEFSYTFAMHSRVFFSSNFRILSRCTHGVRWSCPGKCTMDCADLTSFVTHLCVFSLHATPAHLTCEKTNACLERSTTQPHTSTHARTHARTHISTSTHLHARTHARPHARTGPPHSFLFSAAEDGCLAIFEVSGKERARVKDKGVRVSPFFACVFKPPVYLIILVSDAEEKNKTKPKQKKEKPQRTRVL